MKDKTNTVQGYLYFIFFGLKKVLNILFYKIDCENFTSTNEGLSQRRATSEAKYMRLNQIRVRVLLL